MSFEMKFGSLECSANIDRSMQHEFPGGLGTEHQRFEVSSERKQPEGALLIIMLALIRWNIPLDIWKNRIGKCVRGLEDTAGQRDKNDCKKGSEGNDSTTFLECDGLKNNTSRITNYFFAEIFFPSGRVAAKPHYFEALSSVRGSKVHTPVISSERFFFSKTLTEVVCLLVYAANRELLRKIEKVVQGSLIYSFVKWRSWIALWGHVLSVVVPCMVERSWKVSSWFELHTGQKVTCLEKGNPWWRGRAIAI